MKEPLNVETASALRLGEAILRADTAADDHDRALVRAASAGDQAAFEHLYARYAPMVHGILLARVPRTDVDDLVQEVFVAAWQRLGSLREAGAFGGWLAMIARNRATDFHRQAVPSCELDEGDASTRRDADPAGAAIDAARALGAIRSLPAAYRETLVLRLVEGLSGAEIAARTGLTAASVRVNLHRGMKLLREKLGLAP